MHSSFTILTHRLIFINFLMFPITRWNLFSFFIFYLYRVLWERVLSEGGTIKETLGKLINLDLVNQFWHQSKQKSNFIVKKHIDSSQPKHKPQNESEIFFPLLLKFTFNTQHPVIKNDTRYCDKPNSPFCT